MRTAVLLLVTVGVSSVACHVRAEQLFTPIQTNTGAAKQGLQTSLRLVKNEFGPGESIVAIWQIQNLSNTEQSIALDRKNWRNLAIHACRGTQPVAENLLADGKALEYKMPLVTLEAGASRAYPIDLRALEFVKPQAFEALGRYHIRLIDQSGLETAWVSFRITQPGERQPELTPEQAEKLQEWLTQFFSPDPRQRQQACTEILRLGKGALKALEEAVAREQDPERRARLQGLIYSISAPKPVPPVKPVQPPPPPRPVVPPPPLPQPPLPPPDLEF